MRKALRRVTLKNGYVFDGENVYVQSMLKSSAEDIKGSVNEALLLQNAGCHIIRVAVPTVKDVGLIAALKKSVSCPIVGDIHFDHKIAIEAVKNGADKIRINPGNINKKQHLKEIVDICKIFKVPIRIGVNSGSLEEEILKKYGKVTSDALVESALKNVEVFEKEFDFSDIVVSIKSSNVLDMIDACRKFREKKDIPLHVGVTEAGLKNFSVIKSSIGIGALLADGIGETIRVSITGDSVEEVEVGKLILKALNIKKTGIEIISCPTCGRTKIDILDLTNKVSFALKGCNKNLKVAVMGCVVNGPGEAKKADIGVAGGKGSALLFKKGKVYAKIKEEDILNCLVKEIENM